LKKGLSDLIKQLSGSDIPQSEELKKLLGDLLKAMGQYDLDHPSERVAKEVIFTQQELTDSCK